MVTLLSGLSLLSNHSLLNRVSFAILYVFIRWTFSCLTRQTFRVCLVLRKFEEKKKIERVKVKEQKKNEPMKIKIGLKVCILILFALSNSH